MIKKLVLGLSFVTFLAVPLEAFASAKNMVEPKGAERTRQYWIIVKLCQKKFGRMRQPNGAAITAKPIGGAEITSEVGV